MQNTVKYESFTISGYHALLYVALLGGCATVACDPDDPKFGKDCYQCTRHVTMAAQQDPTMKQAGMQKAIEECMRERGYVKEKRDE